MSERSAQEKIAFLEKLSEFKGKIDVMLQKLETVEQNCNQVYRLFTEFLKENHDIEVIKSFLTNNSHLSLMRKDLLRYLIWRSAFLLSYMRFSPI